MRSNLAEGDNAVESTVDTSEANGLDAFSDHVLDGSFVGFGCSTSGCDRAVDEGTFGEDGDFGSADESAKASGDVVELIKGEFGGLGVGEGHGFVRVRCVGGVCVREVSEVCSSDDLKIAGIGC